MLTVTSVIGHNLRDLENLSQPLVSIYRDGLPCIMSRFEIWLQCVARLLPRARPLLRTLRPARPRQVARFARNRNVPSCLHTITVRQRMMTSARERKYDHIDVVGGLEADSGRQRLRRIRCARVARQTREGP
jgi:hypothetical protein